MIVFLRYETVVLQILFQLIIGNVYGLDRACLSAALKEKITGYLAEVGEQGPVRIILRPRTKQDVAIDWVTKYPSKPLPRWYSGQPGRVLRWPERKIFQRFTGEKKQLTPLRHIFQKLEDVVLASRKRTRRLTLPVKLGTAVSSSIVLWEVVHHLEKNKMDSLNNDARSLVRKNLEQLISKDVRFFEINLALSGDEIDLKEAQAQALELKMAWNAYYALLDSLSDPQTVLTKEEFLGGLLTPPVSRLFSRTLSYIEGKHRNTPGFVPVEPTEYPLSENTIETLINIRQTELLETASIPTWFSGDPDFSNDEVGKKLYQELTSRSEIQKIINEKSLYSREVYYRKIAELIQFYGMSAELQVLGYQAEINQ